MRRPFARMSSARLTSQASRNRERLATSHYCGDLRSVWRGGSVARVNLGAITLLLGVAALRRGAVLPACVDPILQTVVGVTLVVLGAWVLFSVYQYLRGKGEFRLRSRWMLVFDFVKYGWGALQARIHGHEHVQSAHATQYGPKTAFGVGMIHGIGAETGSQALQIGRAH